MPSLTRRGPVGREVAVFLLLASCTLHHVRDEDPVLTTLAGEQATVSVETAPGREGGERVLVTVDHPSFIDLEGAVEADGVLATAEGDPLDQCPRTSLERTDLSPGRRQSRILFSCRYPLVQQVTLITGRDLLPVLEPGGLPVMGPRSWLLSTWIKGEMGVRVTGVPTTRAVDLGINLGARGLILPHLGLGARADALIDTTQGRGQFLAGPEFDFVHATWPCSRCSVEAGVSYLIGYMQGFAHGPEADVRFGVRLARTGTSWHGLEGGVGYRHLIGPDSGGSLVFTLSYSLQTSLRGGFVPGPLRAQPRQLQDLPDLADLPSPAADDAQDAVVQENKSNDGF